MYLFERVEKYAVLFMRIFGKPNLETTGKPNQKTKVLTYWDEAHEVLERYKKEEKEYLKKVSAEIKRAKEFSRAKNKRAAIHCLRRKRVYEQLVEHLEKCQLLILDQLTIVTLATGVAMMKDKQKAAKIDDVEKTTDEMIEQADDLKLIQDATPIGSSANFVMSDDLKLIQDALSTPMGSSADFDLHELEAELKELERVDLVEQLLQASTTAPAVLTNVPAGRQPTRSVAQKRTAEEEELPASDGDDSLKRKRLI